MKNISYREFLVQLTESSRKMDFPSHGSFELTPLCNLDCKMCYIHLQDPSVKQRMLSGDQWISIMQEAVKRGMLSALLTGGEALTHPDFHRIYMFLLENGVSPRLKSNGLLLNKENLDFLKKYPPYLIDVSLYGCDSESYIAVTGHDAFATVRENVRAAIDAGLCVRLMITPSKYMQPWTEKVMAFAKSFGAAKVIVNNLLIDAREETGRSKEDFDLSPAENSEIHKKKQELFPLKFMPAEEEERIYGKIEKHADVSEHGLYCNGGRTGFAVSWDGTMLPCLDFPRELLSANPLRDGFDAAWKAINQGVREYAVPLKCHSCPINTKCHYCPTQHGKCSLKHECNGSVCAYWHNIYDKELEK